jgi:hypothetical protein
MNIYGEEVAGLITHGAMRHSWGLEFQEAEREEMPNDDLRSVMVTNQSGGPKSCQVAGLGFLFFQHG